MIRQKKEELKNYVTDHRIWQGIPSIEITKKGRIFVTFYSGSGGERLGNFAVVVKSDDDGKTFSEPVVAAYKDEKHRCFDPCLWLDPLGRLWFTWSIMPDDALYASVCEDPDADEPVWSDAFYVGEDIMMNKPTVLSTGEWYFPIAVWLRDSRKIYRYRYDVDKVPGAFVYKTVDNGKTFEKLGGADAGRRDFDEHMIVELKDDVLANYVRTSYGIGVCLSYDRGRTWTNAVTLEHGGTTVSRFHIRRLKSGRLLLVHHKDTNNRDNLAAFLSEDEGKTWPYSLVLDERNWVSYPDAVESDDGFIYIVYDRERQGVTLEQAYAKAREVLMAKITEEDIIAGKLVNKDSRMKGIVSKLGKFYDESLNIYEEPDRYSDSELAQLLLKKYPDDIAGKIFEFYSMNCVNMSKMDGRKLDELIDTLEKTKGDRTDAVINIISFVRSASNESVDAPPLVNAVKDIILKNAEEDLSIQEIAGRVGASAYYIMHQFKEITGTTIAGYKQELKLAKAKRLLLNTDFSITEIARLCGYGSPSYFSEIFMNFEKISPTEYRKQLKHS